MRQIESRKAKLEKFIAKEENKKARKRSKQLLAYRKKQNKKRNKIAKQKMALLKKKSKNLTKDDLRLILKVREEIIYKLRVEIYGLRRLLDERRD